MNHHDIRMNAITFALTWASQAGSTCPHCLMGMAIVFSEFLETGDVTDFDHPDEEDAQLTLPEFTN